MSNELALATVTAALALRVQAAAQRAVSDAIVEIGRPGGSDPRGTQHRVNVYLYHVAYNAIVRGPDLFGRQGRTQSPPVAMDLYYLLACYGHEQMLEPERMLGAVVRDLHARPFLTRADIEDAIASHPELRGSDLAGAGDTVGLTPVTLSLGELARLWSVFSPAPHALSIVYQATVLLGVGEETADRPADG